MGTRHANARRRRFFEKRNRIFYAREPRQIPAWKYHVYDTWGTREALHQNFSRYGLLARLPHDLDVRLDDRRRGRRRGRPHRPDPDRATASPTGVLSADSARRTRRGMQRSCRGTKTAVPATRDSEGLAAGARRAALHRGDPSRTSTCGAAFRYRLLRAGPSECVPHRKADSLACAPQFVDDKGM